MLFGKSTPGDIERWMGKPNIDESLGSVTPGSYESIEYPSRSSETTFTFTATVPCGSRWLCPGERGPRVRMTYAQAKRREVGAKTFVCSSPTPRFSPPEWHIYEQTRAGYVMMMGQARSAHGSRLPLDEIDAGVGQYTNTMGALCSPPTKRIA